MAHNGEKSWLIQIHVANIILKSFSHTTSDWLVVCGHMTQIVQSKCSFHTTMEDGTINKKQCHYFPSPLYVGLF